MKYNNNTDFFEEGLDSLGFMKLKMQETQEKFYGWKNPQALMA